MEDESRYSAVRSRDARFDGEFFFAVRTTGIYCRPSCPATTPLRRNVRFYPSAAAAQHDGFRACRRCRPDAVPGSAAWHARADAAARAMRLIADGVVDREGVDGLAARLGYSTRQLRRQLTAEVGAGPVALARAQRAQTARVLLQTTGLPVTEIAFAAGFASVRQFNDTIRKIYATTPGGLRAARQGPPVSGGQGIALRLAYRGPYAARQIFDFLARRAVPGVEEVEGSPGSRVYRRTLRLPGGPGIAAVHEADGGRGWLDCTMELSEVRDLTAATQRIRRLFDLDADPGAVTERFADDPALGPESADSPGLRAPGASDPHEAAVRAILGQQVTVAAARDHAAVLVSARGTLLPEPSGSLTHLFPDAETLAAASLEELRMPRARRAALRALAEALTEGRLVLDAGADRDEAEKELLALPGIGPWTAAYIRMRALGDPDVLPPGDVALRQALARKGDPDTVAWSPWRSYATHLLWNSLDRKDRS
ncbi:AlkA N-terminal domain-containing protein [Actinocorallia populi]|uniref:AlkA N-terminal domain-containing protein n=1 Tax=Actinocorallia populi TaxID=2079200 RepID=UPI000D094AE1|nr:AlkA N-terminal domain-containing protein [Actinocorallia populi]